MFRAEANLKGKKELLGSKYLSPLPTALQIYLYSQCVHLKYTAHCQLLALASRPHQQPFSIKCLILYPQSSDRLTLPLLCPN